MEPANPKALSPSTLAFVGDAVYGLLVRRRLAEINRPAGVLHKKSVELVNASAQAAAYELLREWLTGDEEAVFRRGRNSHTSGTPKNATGKEYQTATGLEALFGYLYLLGDTDRLERLFDLIWDDYTGNTSGI